MTVDRRRTVRFDSLPIGAKFTHEQFGLRPFTKDSEKTAILIEADGRPSRFWPTPWQPIEPWEGEEDKQC
jgi:hypothetical protein